MADGCRQFPSQTRKPGVLDGLSCSMTVGPNPRAWMVQPLGSRLSDPDLEFSAITFFARSRFARLWAVMVEVRLYF